MDIDRKIAYDTLLEIEKNDAYSNIELNKQLKACSCTNVGFVRELVYGVLEKKIHLDFILDFFIPRGTKKLKKHDLTLLRMGVYQLKFMNSVPEYAAVNETVTMAKKFCRGRDGFINGVLRNYVRRNNEIVFPKKEDDVTKYLSVEYSILPWIIELWIKEYGIDQTEEILDSNSKSKGISIRVNLNRKSVEMVKSKLEKEGFEVLESGLSKRCLRVKGNNLLDTESYKKGDFSIQEEASILATEILNPEKNQYIIDMCAAPGGKTLAMAEWIENEGKIVAFDVFSHKLDLINNQCSRLGITCVEAKVGDGESFNRDYEKKADRVLCDVPCSGLGVIFSKPEIKYKDVPDRCTSLSKKQLSILNNGARYLKNGGELLYSTCTINRKENEDVVEAFLKENNEFKKLYEKQFLPCVDGTDGFFICKLKKID